MKNLKFLTVFLSILFLGLASVNAQKGQNKVKHPKKDAAKFINRTNMIMAATGQKVKINKVYTGCLHRAKILETEAIGHFNKNQFKKTVIKSYKARRFSFIAYRANDGTVPNLWRLNEKEKRMIQNYLPETPTDEELEAEVTDEDKTADETEDGIVEDVSGTDSNSGKKGKGDK